MVSDAQLRLQRPFFIAILAVIFALISLSTFVLEVFSFFGWGDGMGVAINDELLTKSQKYSTLGGLMAVGGSVTIGAALSWGFYQARNWSRYVFVGLFTIPVLLGVFSSELGILEVLVYATYLGWIYWYFFLKENVCYYFTLSNKSFKQPKADGTPGGAP